MAEAIVNKGTFARESDLLFLAASAWDEVSNEAAIMDAINAHSELTFKKTEADTGTHAAAEHTASDGATEEQRHRLRELNRQYLDRFGFIFLTSAFGRTPGSILKELETRLLNKQTDELAQAKFQEGLILMGRVHSEAARMQFPLQITTVPHGRTHKMKSSVVPQSRRWNHPSLALGIAMGLGIGMVLNRVR